MARFVVACFLISVAMGQAAKESESLTRSHEAIAPAWIVDLRNSIGNKPIGVVTGRGREIQGRPRSSLWFLNEGTVAATFVVRSGEVHLSKRTGFDANSPLELKIILLDATTGGVRSTTSLPTTSRFAGIAAALDGKLVVQRGQRLSLFSAELQESKSLELPKLESGEWHAYPSPSGKTLLFVATNLRTTTPVPWILVDTERFIIARSWTDVQSGWVTVSDRYFAMTTCIWVYNCDAELRIASTVGEWKTLDSVSARNKPRPKFISDELLFLSAIPKRLVNVDGRLLFTEGQDNAGCWWGEPIPSANRRRFILPICKVKGAVSSLDISGFDELVQVRTYDAPFSGYSHVLDVTGPKLKNLTLLAVSANGLKIALLNGESVELLELPALK